MATPGFNLGQGTRFYVEETDREMDLWIKISKRTTSFNPQPRRLKLTVTVIKKNCGTHNPFYRQCSYSNHCIRREFFCDGRINCAWPDAEHGGTDEVKCDESKLYRWIFDREATQAVLKVLNYCNFVSFLALIIDEFVKVTLKVIL